VGEDGSFGLTMQLEPGENVLSGYSIDKTGNESAESKRYTVKFDDEPPELEITEPVDGANITLRKNQLTTIKGTTEENAKIELNGRLVYASADGSFSTTYQLNEGDNQLLFKAIDEAGNTTEKTIKVTFSF
jgi:phage-related protein